MSARDRSASGSAGAEYRPADSVSWEQRRVESREKQITPESSRALQTPGSSTGRSTCGLSAYRRRHRWLYCRRKRVCNDFRPAVLTVVAVVDRDLHRRCRRPWGDHRQPFAPPTSHSRVTSGVTASVHGSAIRSDSRRYASFWVDRQEVSGHPEYTSPGETGFTLKGSLAS